MKDNYFVAGISKVIFLSNNQIIGIGKALTQAIFNISSVKTEVRGSRGHILYSNFFHSGNMTLSITNSLFNLEQIASVFGSDIESGGILLYESKNKKEFADINGNIYLPKTIAPVNGEYLCWYKKSSDKVWQSTRAYNNTITIPGANLKDGYCVKFFYYDENAEKINVKASYIPNTLSIIVFSDLYKKGGVGVNRNAKAGTISIHIPRFQLDGNFDLTAISSSNTAIEIKGTALSVVDKNSCNTSAYYGYMTQEIYGDKWQNKVMMIKPVVNVFNLERGEEKTLQMIVYYYGGIPPQIKDNSYFTFTMVDGSANGSTIGENSGILVAGQANGLGKIKINLTGYPNIASAYVDFSVSGDGFNNFSMLLPQNGWTEEDGFLYQNFTAASMKEDSIPIVTSQDNNREYEKIICVESHSGNIKIYLSAPLYTNVSIGIMY